MAERPSSPTTRPRPQAARRSGRVAWIAAAIIAVVAGGWWWRHGHPADDAAAFRTATVDRGVIQVAISATGNLGATSTVQIGAQVSGLVTEVLVDFNDHVRKDQVIARIDPSNLDAKVQQGASAVAAARAQLAQAQASARNAEADFARKSDLAARQLIARSDLDLARAARDQAVAAATGAQAQIASQQAALGSAQADLGHSVIRSPVDGVVITRAVEPGQTVATSLQTPTLFEIAEDLRKMEIVLAVDEADIGQVKVGQHVHFNVDAFPDRDFGGTVRQVRLAATNTQNVITYPVVVTVDNEDGTLLPGMTVNADIQITRRDDVLRVPNAALRWRPPDAPAEAAASPQQRGGAMLTDALPGIAASLHLDATQQKAFDDALAAVKERAKQQRAQRESAQSAQSNAAGLFGGRPPGAAGAGPGSGGQRGAGQRGAGRGGAQGAQRMLARIGQQFADFRATLRPDQQQAWDGALQSLAAQKRGAVWKLVAGKPQQASVQLGATDGSMTEVVGGDVKAGDQVVVGAAAAPATKP